MKTSNEFGKHNTTECETSFSVFGANAERYSITFPNGYGASIIRNAHSYGGNEGLFEVAVIGKDNALCYDTPITSDVEGYLTREEVAAMLAKIEGLGRLWT